MSESHRINRDRRGPDDEPDQTFVCDHCGEEYDSRDRYESHRDREKRAIFRGSPIGDQLLQIDRDRRGKF